MWTLSNILSLLRLLMAVPAGYFLWINEKEIVLVLIFLGVVTDVLDGYFARKLNQVTEFGKIIDPLADKAFILTLIAIALIQGKMPLWIGLVLFIRDILILVAGLYFKNKLGFVIPSNYTGKITVDIIGLYLILVILEYNTFASYLVWLVLAGALISLTHYAIRALKMLKDRKTIN